MKHTGPLLTYPEHPHTRELLAAIPGQRSPWQAA